MHAFIPLRTPPLSSCDPSHEPPSRQQLPPEGPLLPLQLILLHAPRHVQEILLLLQMRGLQTGRHRRRRVAASVHDVLPVVVLGVVQQGLDTRLGERPGASV